MLFITSVRAENSLLDWPQGYEKHNAILELAKMDEKPILVYFYTDWCPYCKKLNKDYLSSPEFKALSSGIYRVQINPEKSKVNNRLFTNVYKGKGYPSVYVYVPKFSKSGKKLTPFYSTGYLTANEYVQLIAETISLEFNKKAFEAYKSGNFELARDYIFNSLAYDMQNKYALLLLGSIYHKEGNIKNDNALIDKARQLYKKILTIYPGDKDILAALTELDQ